METEDVANQWAQLIKNKKVQRTTKALLSTPKSSIQQPPQNNINSSNMYNNDQSMLQSKQSNNSFLLEVPPKSNITSSNINQTGTMSNNNPSPPPVQNTTSSYKPQSNNNTQNIPTSTYTYTNPNTNNNMNSSNINPNNTNMNNSKINNSNINSNPNPNPNPNPNANTNTNNSNLNNSNLNNSNLNNSNLNNNNMLTTTTNLNNKNPNPIIIPNSKINQNNDNYLKDSYLNKSTTNNIINPKNPDPNPNPNSDTTFNPTTSIYKNPNNNTSTNPNNNIKQSSVIRNSQLNNNRDQFNRNSSINNLNNSNISLNPNSNPNNTNTNTNTNLNSKLNTNTNTNTNTNVKPTPNNSYNKPPSNAIGSSNINQHGGRYPIKQQLPPKSIIKPSTNINTNIDWNLKFIQQHNQQTITQFTNHVLQTFLTLSPQTITLRNISNQQQSIKLTKNGINFYLASHGTKIAFQLNRQYQNYHYILECCKQSRFINVPLCCVVQYLGLYCLAKAAFPDDVDVVGVRNGVQAGLGQQLRMLESYTKLSSQSIKRSATILNLTKWYQKQGNFQRIFIDNLIDYLPADPQSPRDVLRSQLLIQNLTKTINLKHPQSIPELTSMLNKSLHTLAQSLSQHENILTSYTDVKQLLYQYGLNLSVLPELYNLVRSRFTKRYIYTVMVCRIVKESVMMSVMDIRENGEMGTLGDVVQEVFRVFCQGDRGEEGLRQVWNNTAQEFKKKYRANFNINQIQPGFFLSTLLTMMSVQFNIKKLDKSKRLMQDINIINNGFFIQFKPKIKSYYKFLTQNTLKILNLCKTPSNNLSQLSKYIDLTNPETFPSYEQHKKLMLCHLSTEISPSSSSHKQTSSLIYSYLNIEPPTLVSHSISLNYADHCLKQNKVEQYKKIVENCVDIINYWLGQDHILLCDVFQSLAQYYQGKACYDDCINYMKQALTTCIRLTGTHTYRVGLQYFRLAEKQLKYGETKQALENYYKAKQNLQAHPNQSKQYPISLLRIANLQLSSNNIDKCIIFCIKSLKQSQQNSLPDTTSIKIYELLCRAYQLNTNKQQLLNLAHLTAKYFNNTTSTYVFDQMIRICLVGFLMVLQPSRQDRFIQYMKLVQGKQDNGRIGGGLEKLMLMARNWVVMEKFWKGLEGIDRWAGEIRHGRIQSVQGKEFKMVMQGILQIVGKDFIEGILTQSKYW